MENIVQLSVAGRNMPFWAQERAIQHALQDFILIREIIVMEKEMLYCVRLFVGST